jgi:DtxR family transcriptional regulator, manganese transport regulator
MAARTGKKKTLDSAREIELRSAEEQARIHRQTRSANDSETAQDYLEVIADLIDTCGEARAVDIARRLGVTHVTVIKTIARLKRDGYVVTQPYRAIFLTDDGRDVAEATRARHRIVVSFLKALGISEEAAEVDAEGIEHHVSNETLEAFRRFTESSRKRN